MTPLTAQSTENCYFNIAHVQCITVHSMYHCTLKTALHYGSNQINRKYEDGADDVRHILQESNRWRREMTSVLLDWHLSPLEPRGQRQTLLSAPNEAQLPPLMHFTLAHACPLHSSAAKCTNRLYSSTDDLDPDSTSSSSSSLSYSYHHYRRRHQELISVIK